MTNVVCHLFLFFNINYTICFIRQWILARRCVSVLHTYEHIQWTQYVFVPHRSLTRNITRPGTASLGGTSAATWLMRPSISFTSTWVRWPFCCSSPAEGTHSLHISWPHIQYWLTRQRHLSFLGKGPLPFSVLLSTLLSLRIKKNNNKKTWPC